MTLDNIIELAVWLVVIAIVVNLWSALIEGPSTKKNSRRILG